MKHNALSKNQIHNLQNMQAGYSALEVNILTTIARATASKQSIQKFFNHIKEHKEYKGEKVDGGIAALVMELEEAYPNIQEWIVSPLPTRVNFINDYLGFDLDRLELGRGLCLDEDTINSNKSLLDPRGLPKKWREYPEFALTKMPDFADVILQDAIAFQNTPQPQLACAAVLHGLSLAASKATSPRGFKLNLIIIIIAPSASGKDSPQEYLMKSTSLANLGKYVISDIRSDADLINNLIEQDGTNLYVIDEVHGFFDNLENKNAAPHLRNVGPSILKMYSNRVLKLNGLQRRSLKADLKEQKKAAMTDAKEKGAIHLGEEECLKLQEIFDDMENNGLPDPFISLLGSSTPVMMDGFINDRTLQDGWLGRVILMKGAEDRPESPFESKKKIVSNEVATKLREIRQSHQNITWGDGAKETLEDLHCYYQQNEIRNHDRFGAVFARIHEQVEKVASILAVSNNFIMTPEHILWAHEFEYLSIKNMIETDKNNSISSVSNDDDLYYSFISRISEIMDNKPIAISTISQRLSTTGKKRLPLRVIIEEYAKRVKITSKEVFAFLLEQITDIKNDNGVILCGGKVVIEDAEKFLNAKYEPDWFKVELNKYRGNDPKAMRK